MILNSIYWNTRELRAPVREYLRQLEEFNNLSPTHAQFELTSRLMSQLRYFASREDSLPEWREAAKISDPDMFWEAWSALPILKKQDLQNRFHPDRIRSISNIEGIASATGGSTGEPTPYFHDLEMLNAKTAATVYCRRKFGWRPGMVTIVLWGSERDIGSRRSLRARLTSRLMNEWIIDGYSLNSDTVRRLRRILSWKSPVAIYGFTGLLEFAARQFLEQGMRPREGQVQAAWNGGEMLFDHQSELFRRAFGVPILNLYGGRELSAMAFQPREKASLKVLRPLLFVELVDDDGKPVSPGSIGHLVWTSTICRGTPFLRYEIGDLATCDSRDQDESGVRALSTLQGRSAGLIRFSNGKIVGGLFWNHLFKDYREVRKFQVAAGKNRIDLRLLGDGFVPDREMHLRKVLGEFLGTVDISIHWVDTIQVTQQSKLMQVVPLEE